VLKARSGPRPHHVLPLLPISRVFLTAHPKIETERLTLRLVEEADLTPLLAINADDSVTRYLPYESWKGIADAQAWLGRASVRFTEGEAGQFVIEHRGSRQVIGTTLLFRFDKSNARAEVGYALSRTYWGAGYMLEAMKAFVAFAFEQVSLRRLEAEIDPRNLSSAKLLERLGFVREGHLRERWAMKGEVTDSGLYGLLRTEWALATAAQVDPIPVERTHKSEWPRGAQEHLSPCNPSPLRCAQLNR
jgi:[ribosomal protein S5]-alanine N-acetyltransferase